MRGNAAISLSTLALTRIAYPARTASSTRWTLRPALRGTRSLLALLVLLQGENDRDPERELVDNVTGSEGIRAPEFSPRGGGRTPSSQRLWNHGCRRRRDGLYVGFPSPAV